MLTDSPARPRLLVSIVNHNSVDALLRCLESLVDETPRFECDIWVVDNLCEERAAAAVRRRFPEVTIVENDATLGLSANHNQVLLRRAHDVDFVLLLNPDVQLYPQSIIQLVTAMAEHPDAAACGPQLIDANGAAQPPRGRAVSPLRDALLTSAYISNLDPERLRKLIPRWRRSNPTRMRGAAQTPAWRGSDGAARPPEPVPVVSGACMLLRSSAIASVGVYDERFFLYFAETDWCLRAASQGWRVYHVPHVRVFHEGGVSTRRAYTRYLQVYAESEIKFYHKHSGWWVAMGMQAVLSAVAGVNLARWTLRSWRKSAERVALQPWIRLSRTLPAAMWGALQSSP